MADDELRESERAWRATPEDQAALARLIAALRRAGQVVPEALLQRRIRPGCTFRSRTPARVRVRDANGSVMSVGDTLASGVVEVPRHAWFEVASVGELEPDELRALAHDCAEQAVERVDLRLRAETQPVGLDWPALTHLALDSAMAFDTQVLSDLRGPALVGLSLRGARTPGRLAPLVDAAPGLERLDLGLVFGMSDQDIAPLGTLSRLRVLKLSAHGPQVGHALRGRFLSEAFLNLRELDLSDFPLGPDQLKLLTARTLYELGLTLDRNARPDDLRRALAAGTVERLTLDAKQLPPASLGFLSELPLTCLSIDQTLLPGSVIELFPRSIVHLQVATFGSPSWFGRFSALRSLTLSLEGACDLHGLAAARGLTQLSLHGQGVDGARALLELKDLEELRLWCSPIALGPLRCLERLGRLMLGGPGWRDEDLEGLARLPALKVVQLYGCTGLGQRALDRLVACRSLRELEILRCPGLSEEALGPFRSARPDVVVDR